MSDLRPPAAPFEIDLPTSAWPRTPTSRSLEPLDSWSTLEPPPCAAAVARREGASNARPQPSSRCRDPGRDLEEFLFGRDLGEHADLPAFVDGTTGAALTFRELHEQVLRVAAALAQRGIGRGDVVALYAPNSPAWAAVFHGVLRANATLTSVNALYTAGELAAQLADSRARMIVTTAALLERAQAAAKEVGIDDDPGRPGRRQRPRLARRPARVHRGAARTGGRPGRPRRAALLLGHLRPAQGRDAHPPEPGREPAAVARDHARRPGHAIRRGAAVLPHLRHDVPAQPGDRPAVHGRHPAPVRPGRVPAGDRAVPGPAGPRGPADPGRAGQAPARRLRTTCRRSRPSTPARHRWTPTSPVRSGAGWAAAWCRATA